MSLFTKSSKKRLFLSLVTVLAVAFFAYDVHAQTLNTGLQFGAQIGLGNQDIRVTIAKIIRIILGFLGIIAVGLTMYAGFLWMTAKGNEEQIEKAKGFLKNAAIGLAIILSSFAIVSFILSRLLLATTGGFGNNNGNGGNSGSGGLSGLGNGIVKSVYPEPFQENVPMNTSIIVTFREAMRASSLCVTVNGDKCAPGSKMKTGSVKIYQTAVGDGVRNVKDAVVSSLDNKTFVFKPAPSDYLGSSTETLDYTVNLTRDIKKANGDPAFSLTDFRWSFKTGKGMDTESPIILKVDKGGIYPPTDNEADTVSGATPAVAATGTIKVMARPNEALTADAKLFRTSPNGGAIGASVQGTNTCLSQEITFSIATQGNGVKAIVAYGNSTYDSGELPVINSRINLGPCNLVVVFDPLPAVGSAWRLKVVKARAADTLTVGAKTYQFVTSTPQGNQILIGATNQATAANIDDAINSTTNINPDVIATVQKEVVTVKAKVAGAGGSNIELSGVSGGLTVTRMSGGSDRTVTFTVKGKRDQPKNSVIQINFSEAINPLTLSGKSSDVAPFLRVINSDKPNAGNGAGCAQNSDCRSFRCLIQGQVGTCQGDELAGTFQVSNQYKTAEFISDIKCGVNGCGENIYCLPPNANLRVETFAATLKRCTSAADCTAPFSACTNNVCRDPVKNQNLGTASQLDGIVDAADNSLDGNRNTDPQGKASVFNENDGATDVPAGDNYRWSFWTNDKLDLTPPRLKIPSIPNKTSGAPLSGFYTLPFTKVMMSASLSTGSVVVNNGIKDITHKLINLWSLSTTPIGYWVRKEDAETGAPDGQMDYSIAKVLHGTFNDSTAYRAQVGSGVKDIYQNCFKPSAADDCGATAEKPSCCRKNTPPYNLIATDAVLTSDGNCPPNL